LLVNQALLVKEITELKTTDIDLEKGEIRISKTGKNNARTLPLKSPQILLFYNYLKERESVLKQTKKQTESFIINKYGNPLSPHGISRLINEGKDDTDKILPLKIRQSVIAHLLKGGGDLRTVQVFAGHRRSSSTESYKLSEWEALQASVNQYHPIR
jgi:integrase/recombinase XerD